MNTIQEDINKARNSMLSVQQSVGERTLEATRKNTNAFINLFSEGLSVRTPDDAKNFFGTFARVGRETLETGVELMQANARDLAQYGQETTEAVKHNVEKAVKSAKDQVSKKR